MTVHASCLCGDVAFTAEAPFLSMSHCHCSMCRKTHGAAFATFVAVEAKGFHWTRGVERIRRFKSSASGERNTCTRCGSALPWDSVGEHVFFPAGLLDDDPGVRPIAHIFVGSKAPWYEIPGPEPQFEAYPPGFGEAVERPAPAASSGGGVHGSCLCGEVAYQIDPPVPGPIVSCHCNRCRKARAAAHASNFFVAIDHFRWTRGEGSLSAFKVPEAERFTHVVCRGCGSTMPFVSPARGLAVVPAGSLDVDPGVRPGLHIFVGSKAPWFEIHDALPQHAEYPPGSYPPAPRR